MLEVFIRFASVGRFASLFVVLESCFIPLVDSIPHRKRRFFCFVERETLLWMLLDVRNDLVVEWSQSGNENTQVVTTSARSTVNLEVS